MAVRSGNIYLPMTTVRKVERNGNRPQQYKPKSGGKKYNRCILAAKLTKFSGSIRK